MTFDGGANWNARADLPQQAPVYWLEIDGVTEKWATRIPKGWSGNDPILGLEVPKSSGVQLDLLKGSTTTQVVTVELVDVATTTNALTDPSRTVVNRTGTLYAGYADQDVGEYTPRFVGRLRGLELSKDLTTWVLRFHDNSYLLTPEIMLDADEPLDQARILGNPVNVYASILRDSFSTTGDFPLIEFSGPGGTGAGSAPTGLGIPDSLLNLDQMKAERDRWYQTALVEATWQEPVGADRYLEKEFFRTFQCFPAIDGAGRIGLRFVTPAFGASPVEVTADEHIAVYRGWKRDLRAHVNDWLIRGDATAGGVMQTELYSVPTAEDLADQQETGEVITWRVDSLWLRTLLDGAFLASNLVNRARARYLQTPALLDLGLLFSRQRVEQGDVISVTAPTIPDLQRGERGLDRALLLVISASIDWEKGLHNVLCLDTSYRRYGGFTPSTLPDYTFATADQRRRYAYISSPKDPEMSNGDPGYLIP